MCSFHESSQYSDHNLVKYNFFSDKVVHSDFRQFSLDLSCGVFFQCYVLSPRGPTLCEHGFETQRTECFLESGWSSAGSASWKQVPVWFFLGWFPSPHMKLSDFWPFISLRFQTAYFLMIFTLPLIFLLKETKTPFQDVLRIKESASYLREGLKCQARSNLDPWIWPHGCLSLSSTHTSASPQSP